MDHGSAVLEFRSRLSLWFRRDYNWWNYQMTQRHILNSNEDKKIIPRGAEKSIKKVKTLIIKPQSNDSCSPIDCVLLHHTVSHLGSFFKPHTPSEFLPMPPHCSLSTGFSIFPPTVTTCFGWEGRAEAVAGFRIHPAWYIPLCSLPRTLQLWSGQKIVKNHSRLWDMEDRLLMWHFTGLNSRVGFCDAANVH